MHNLAKENKTKKCFSIDFRVPSHFEMDMIRTAHIVTMHIRVMHTSELVSSAQVSLSPVLRMLFGIISIS